MAAIYKKTIRYIAWYSIGFSSITFVLVHFYINFQKRRKADFSSRKLCGQEKPFIYKVEIPNIVETFPFNNCISALSIPGAIRKRGTQDANSYWKVAEKV